MRYWWRTQKSWRCRTASRCCGCKRRKMENSIFSSAVKCATIKGSFEVTRWRTLKQMRWFNFEFFWHELTFSKKSWLKSLILSTIMFYIRCQTFQWVGSARKNTNPLGVFVFFFRSVIWSSEQMEGNGKVTEFSVCQRVKISTLCFSAANFL